VLLRDPDNRAYQATSFTLYPPGTAPLECFQKVAWVEVKAEAPPDNPYAMKSGGVLTFWLRASAAVTYAEKDNAWFIRDLTALEPSFMNKLRALKEGCARNPNCRAPSPPHLPAAPTTGASRLSPTKRLELARRVTRTRTWKMPH